MMNNRRIGIYGGTFDPIHFGHLNLAVELMEFHRLDEVWLLPNNQNPHKLEQSQAPAEHRLKMVELAVSGMEGLSCIDIELKRPAPSYMSDTLQQLIEESPEKEFFLIIGDDALPKFHLWHEPETIVSLVTLVVGKRGRDGGKLVAEASETLQRAVLAGMTENAIMEISATKIRQRLKKGLYCRHLVPAPVLAYIKNYHLYY